MKFFFRLLLGVLAFVAGCRQAPPRGPQLDFFDVAPDDRRVIFNWVENDISSIEELDMETGQRRSVFHGEPHISYFRPSYSTDGQRIAFIRTVAQDRRGHVCIADHDGSNMDTLARNVGIVTEVLMSASGEQVFFITAREFTNYSPLARKAPHKFDLYAVEISTKKVWQLTHVDAYAVSNLSRLGSDRLVFRLDDGDMRGLYSLNVDRHGQSPQPFPTPQNVGLSDDLFYGAEASARWNKILYRAPADLFVANPDGSGAKRPTAIDDRGQFRAAKWFSQTESVLYSCTGSRDLFLVDPTGDRHQRLRLFPRATTPSE